MMMKTMVTLITLAAIVQGIAGLEVVFTGTGQDTRYHVTHGGRTLFVASPVAVFADGEWSSQADGTLSFLSTRAGKGADPKLGAYTSTSLEWVTKNSTPFTTTVNTFSDGHTVTFEQSWPKGATGTSLVKADPTNKDAHNGVIANFPAMQNWTLPNTVSWAGSFVGGQVNSGTKVVGAAGGPTVFYDATDDVRGYTDVIVLSPLDHFKATTAGPGFAADGVTEAFAPGTAGTITSIPAGFTHKFVLMAGTTGGVTAAIGEWGTLMQRYYSSYKLSDPTLTNIGYQTDNGAGYVFCRPEPPYHNCDELLIDEIHQLKEAGVPMGYLSYQGGGVSTMAEDAGRNAGDAAANGAPFTSRAEGDRLSAASVAAGAMKVAAAPSPPKEPSAPWCVNEWSVDLNMTQRSHGQFPMNLKNLTEHLGVPLQLYAPYFCPESKYFKVNNPDSKWTSVQSDITLPGCSYYGFQDVEPSQSRAFYDEFFARGQAAGMVSFEPDFMNQNYNCVPAFIESVDNSSIWQHGMTDAALALNLTVQWCYAAPTDVLSSLEMPALTNFRVSNDFCYGESWKVGVSSLIVWAAGSAPSKDTLWTTDNGKFSVPGCPWTPDHEEPAAELHVVIALMTTGPVGISDLVGQTNATLAKRTIMKDGTLLKPSKPLTTVDSDFGSTSPPTGFVYTTYTGESLAAPTAWYFVSFKMTKAWPIPKSDFYPALGAGAAVVARTYSAGGGCVNGSAASACVDTITAGSDPTSTMLAAPLSDHTNVTAGTDYAPTVSTVWPVCTSGWVFLGELHKYVAVSPLRFQGVECTSTGVTATVSGSAGEKVQVTLITPAKTILQVEVSIPASGSIIITE